MSVIGEHRFIARVRAGAATTGLSTAGSAVTLELEGAEPVGVEVALHEPGSVASLDGSAITRRVPRAGAADFEPNLFAAIELAHPALPWMLSPPLPINLPWMTLVVVEDRAGVVLAGSILTIAAPAELARELPDLRQAWAWVHAHGVGASGAPIAASAFAHSSGPTSARLICPRRLAPHTRYHAALVPVFARGVQAGLGEVPTAAAADLAWTDDTALPLRLPVYHAWSFTTGADGDFAALARRLRPRTVAVARREVAADRPGWGQPEQPGRSVTVGGALEPLDTAPIVPSPQTTALGAAIGEQIATADETMILAPPAYGAFATGAAQLADAPPWMQRVNTDVRLRIAAGLGSEVVRREQDAMVAEVWHQLGAADAAAQVLRQAELAAVITRRLLARHIDGLASDAELLHVARPAHRRLRIADGDHALTVAAELAESALPTRGASAAFRRLARPGARIARRTGAALAGPLVDRANRDELRVAPPRQPLDGLAALDAISAAEKIQPRYTSARAGAIDESATFWRGEVDRRRMARPTAGASLRRRSEIPAGEEDWSPGPISEDVDPDPVEIDEFAIASRRHQRYLIDHLRALPAPRPRRPFGRGSLAPLRARVRAAAEPSAALVPLVAQTIDGHVLAPDRPFATIASRPLLERPMMHALRAIDVAHLVPGFGQASDDTVALFEPDHDVVTSFLLGINHELAAELAWRRCPVANDATLVRSFWGRTAPGSDGSRVVVPDIPPIADWPADGPPAPPVALVLLIRGELVRRYPGAIVYLIEASWRGTHRVIGVGPQRAPLFRMTLADDAALYGFDVTRDAAAGSPRPGPAGWYVVIEEHPQEPRFGLGAEPEPVTLATWRDLRWSHVADGDLRGGTHLGLAGPLATRRPADDGGFTWGHDAAQQAAITLRRPTRIAIHASLLLPLTEPG